MGVTQLLGGRAGTKDVNQEKKNTFQEKFSRFEKQKDSDPTSWLL